MATGSGKQSKRGGGTKGKRTGPARTTKAVVKRATRTVVRRRTVSTATAGARLRMTLAEFEATFVLPQGLAPKPPPTAEDLARFKQDLRERLAVLFGDEMRKFMARQSAARRQQYLEGRIKLQQAVDAITEKELNDLADELEANAEALKAGINNLKRETEKLEDVVRVLGAIAAVVEIVGRIVGMVI